MRRLWETFRGWPRWAQVTTVVVLIAVVAGAASSGGKKKSQAADTSPVAPAHTITDTAIAAAGDRLTGIGATRASFTNAHGLNLRGCPARTCFGPRVATGEGEPADQFQLVNFGGGRVFGYTESFTRGTSLARAKRQTLAGFPKDTSVVKTGVLRRDRLGQSCRWVDVSSSTLKKVLGGRRFFIEFATEGRSGHWKYDQSDINQALISAGWYLPGNPC